MSSLKSMNNTELSQAQIPGATKGQDWIMPVGSVWDSSNGCVVLGHSTLGVQAPTNARQGVVLGS